MSYKLVSVIILSYNNTEYLNECLDSVFSQTYNNIELIVSNDGSDEFDAEKVTTYIEQKRGNNITNFVVNKNEKNVGTVRHCNIAFDLSSGDYVMFIACDDAYNNNNVISDMVNGFNTVPSDVESIVGQTGMYDKDLNVLQSLYTNKKTQKLINKLTPQELYRKHLVQGALFPAAARIYKREVFEKYGKFDEKYFIIEDWTSSFQHAKKGMRTFYLDIMCVNHRDGGISHSDLSPASFAQKMYCLDWITGFEEVLSDKSIDEKAANIALEKLIYRRRLYHDVFVSQADDMNEPEPAATTDKLFSVVILCYQNFDKLKNAVLSVLSQNYPKIEIIISDDASRIFHEKQIINLIEDKENIPYAESVRYKIKCNPVNLGTVKNLKSAMEEVTGDYYITLGADDELYDSDVLRSFSNTFDRFGDTLWWICGASFTCQPDMQTLVRTDPGEYDAAAIKRRDPIELFSLWSRKFIAATPAMAFRTGIADLVGGYDSDNYTYIEDWPLVLKLLRIGNTPAYVQSYAVKHAVSGISNNNSANGISVRRRWLQERRKMFSIEVEPYLDKLYPDDLREYYRGLEWMDKTLLMDLTYFQSGRKQKLKMLLTDHRVFKNVSEIKLSRLKNRFLNSTRDWIKVASFGVLLLIAAMLGQLVGDCAISDVLVTIGYILAGLFLAAVFLRFIWVFVSKFVNLFNRFIKGLKNL